MNIAGYTEDIKGQLTAYLEPYFRIIGIILLAILSLGLYQIWHERVARPPLTVSMTDNGAMNGQATDVYASKTGKKYYFPWCGALNRIQPENRVEYATPALAQAAGLTPAANCKGVK